MDAAEIYAKRLNAKEVLTPRRLENLYSEQQMVQQTCQEETTNSECKE